MTNHVLYSNLKMRNCCAEVMLTKASRVLMDTTVEFKYPRGLKIVDDQVDLSPCFLTDAGSDQRVLVGGWSKEALEQDFADLDRNSAYFVRTGKSGGGGHFQFMYFNNTNNNWMIYSSPTTHYAALDVNGQLTPDGCRLIVAHGEWGLNHGQYSILLIKATPERLIKASNFLYDWRTQGEDAAIEFLHQDQELSFYPQLFPGYVGQARAQPQRQSIQVVVVEQAAQQAVLPPVQQRAETKPEVKPVATPNSQVTVTPAVAVAVRPAVTVTATQTATQTPVAKTKPVHVLDQAILTEAKQIRDKLNQEIKEMSKRCFSFFFRYEMNTKLTKRNALDLLLKAKSLVDMQKKATALMKNKRVMRSMKTNRTKQLILSIVNNQANKPAPKKRVPRP